MRFVRVLLHSTTCATLLLASCVSARAQVVAPFPSTSPQPATPAPDVTVAVPPPVDEGVTGIPALADALRSQQMTPAQAWDKGLLDVASALVLLRQGLFSGEGGNARVRRAALAGVLLDRAPDALLNAAKTDRNTQLALANAYAMRNDPRAVTEYNDLAEHEPAAYPKGLVLFALGDYYRSRGDADKAAEIYLQARPVFSSINARHQMAEARILAASTWQDAGQDEKARVLFALVPEDGDAYMKELAVHTRVRFLCEQRRVAEAWLLARPIVEQRQVSPFKARQMAFLALGYYYAGDFVQARRFCEGVLRDAKGYADQDAMETAVNSAKATLKWTELWSRVPFACEVDELRVDARAEPHDEEIYKWLQLRSYRKLTYSVSCDNPTIRLKITDSVYSNLYLSMQDMVVRIMPTREPPKNMDATITIRCAESPKFELKLPVHIKVLNS